MRFVDLGVGMTVFLDANTFVYHFAPHPVFGADCSKLLQEIQQGRLVGVTSTHVLTELAHRLMTLEACTAFGWPHSKVAQRLHQNPSHIQQLSLFHQAVAEVPNFGVQVLSISPSLVSSATDISRRLGLLSNDALIAAIMQAHGINNLASHDTDFDRVPGITRFAAV